jgi:hypothetical protein
VDNDDPESDPERKRILQAVEKISKGQILAIKKNAQGVIRLDVMPAVNHVYRSKTEQVVMIGKMTVTISLELAKFIKNRTNHGFVFGVCMAAMMSGYAPMSQGWWEFMGHGAVKNWKWLWGTTTWIDKLGYAGIKAADMAHMGVFGGLSNTSLNQMVGLTRSVIDKLHGKPEALDTSEKLPEISDLYRAAEQALESSDDEYGSKKRYRAFRKEFDRLDPAMRHGYLLKVYTDGMRRKMEKQMESQPKSIEDRRGSVPGKKIRAIMPASSSSSYAVTPYGMNNVRLPGQGVSAGPSALTKIQAQRRRRLHRDDPPYAGPASSGDGRGQQALEKQAPLVNYGAGVRQMKKGGGKTIRSMAPILEFNETADDPYL